MPLYLVATPIGNLGDITQRAIETLKSVDVVACEDTRHSQKLFQHLGIRPKTTSYHHHNRHAKRPYLVGLMQAGQSVALVSDAGTPGVSDPGEELVKACIEAGIPVVPIPGPCALIVALVGSGLATDRFAFDGFLPAKAGDRRRRLEALQEDPRSLIFYEAPHRLSDTLGAMQAVFGDRQACVARELTKIHESFLRGPLSELAHHFETTPAKGEIVVLVAGASPVKPTEDEVAICLKQRLAAGCSPSDAAKQVARDLGVPKRGVYEMALKIADRGR